MAKMDTPKKPRRRATTPAAPATAADASPVTAAPDTTTSNPDNLVAPEPNYDDIARAAYLRYLDRGGADGADLDDWIAAERALKHGK